MLGKMLHFTCAVFLLVAGLWFATGLLVELLSAVAQKVFVVSHHWRGIVAFFIGVGLSALGILNLLPQRWGAMKKKRIYFGIAGLIVVIVLGIVGYFSLQKLQEIREKRKPFQVVEVNGIDWGIEGLSNYTLTFGSWWVWGKENKPAGLIVRDGDILSFAFNNEYYYQYKYSDGQKLHFELDDFRVIQGNKTMSLTLCPEGWEWLKIAKQEDIISLRTVGFPEKIDFSDRTILKQLKRLAKINPSVGLIINDIPALHQVLPLFNPKWLMILSSNDLLNEKDLAVISGKRNIEFILFNAEGLKSLEFLSTLPKLRRMALSGWGADMTGPVPGSCKNLKSVHIIDSKIEDLSILSNFNELEELQLWCCESLADIDGLSKFPKLKHLSLFSCNKISHYSVFKRLPNLAWLSLSYISQEEFRFIIRYHTQLQVLELVEWNNIKDLTPLQNLPNLKALVLAGENPDIDYSPLYKMKNLRFLVLPKEYFDEAGEEVTNLEKALPDCLIVPAVPICLGSGWILMLFPLVALSWLLSRQRRKI